MSTSNKACCTIAPVQTDYQPKGTYEDIASIKTYVVGPKDAKKVLLCIYDIFGFWATTQQGADLLADSLQVKVIMPDFLRDHPWPIDGFPPRNEEEGQRLGKWFDTIASIPDRLGDIKNVVAELKSQGVEKIGLYGFCWGGKIVSLSGDEGTPFVGVAQAHPAFVTPEDAKKVTVPLAFFPSKDEPKDDVDAYWANFTQAHPELVEKSRFHHYTDMFHGFGGARANLKDQDNYFAFQDLYTRLGDFFKPLLA